MKICHVITMDNMLQMGEISRIIFNETIGDHIFCNLYDNAPPKADIYILECFKNQLHFPKQILWRPPTNRNLISLVHSSEPCMPSKYSKKVVTITNYWKKRLDILYDIDSNMIHGAIDVHKFDDIKIDYKKKTFGKITRPEMGKYHKDWNDFVYGLLESHNFINCQIVSNGYRKIPYIDHARCNYIEDIKINDIESKKKALSNLSVYTECHNVGGAAFIDTFCISVLEAMAAGLPIIILRGLQEPLCEVIGNAGIICDTFDEYKVKLLDLLLDAEQKEHYGLKAKQRAQFFNKHKMIEDWNKLFMELI